MILSILSTKLGNEPVYPCPARASPVQCCNSSGQPPRGGNQWHGGTAATLLQCCQEEEPRCCPPLPWSGGGGSIRGDQVLPRCVQCIQCMLGSWRRDIEGTSSSLLSPDTPQIGPTPTIQMFDTHSRNAKFQHCQRIEKKMIFHLLAFTFLKL